MTVQSTLALQGVERNVRGNRSGGPSKWPLTVVLLLCAVTVIVPLYVTVSMAFKTPEQAVDGNAFSLPAPFSVEGFVTAWNLTNFPAAFTVSVLITAGSVIGSVVLGAFASYAISRNWNRRLFRWSFFYLLAAMFIPFPVVALPQIQLTGLAGLDNPLGVTILHIMFQLSFSILLFTAFLRSIPSELEESARIDGATTWQTFWQLIFPLLAPMSATVGIFAFLASWNDFMMPSLITSDPALQTLPVVQSIFQTQFSNNYNVSFASYLMAMAPAIIVYLITQRWVMEGVTQGAVKDDPNPPIRQQPTRSIPPVSTTDVITASHTMDATEPAPWWRQATVYQIYPRSFADSNADGLGDLPGIISRADYLESLGIDAVWLSPFYPSALADGGYDVADYRNVDPRLGTLDDFDRLVAALHARSIRVVVDIVPNHTSDLHEWFQEAVAAGRGSAARERYIFREGTGPDGSQPPTDWLSVFGGAAWQRVADGQWYFHNFAVEQPDLNWAHPEVRADFVRTLRFWADRGVDGFRIDVAHMLTKDLTEPLPSQAQLDALPRDGNHPLLDRDDVHEIYAEWRTVFNSYDPPRTAVAEAWVDKARVPLYASPDSLGQAFNFDLLEADFDAAQFEGVVRDNLELAARSGVVEHLGALEPRRRTARDPIRSAHPGRTSDGRPAQKHGLAWMLSGGTSPVLDREKGARRARAATLFMLGLPGSSYLYQGEELGLHEVAEIPDADRQDPTFFRSPGVDPGRDGCRVPLPWSTAGSAFGFGTGGSHLPQPEWFADYAMSAQDGRPDSTLELYRTALALRHTLQTGETLEWIKTGRPDVLRYRRPNGWEVVTNFGTDPYPLDRDDAVLASRPLEQGALAGEATVWFAA